jgi:hypothetical protein
MQLEIIEEYRDYEPRRSVEPYVRDLLRCIPKKHLHGLRRIILTNASGQPRRERREKTYSRKRRVSLNESLGYYRHAWGSEPASIQLHIDRIFKRPNPEKKKWLFWFRLLRPLMAPIFVRYKLGSVLYHEIGHHIHETQAPEFREPEDVADRYGYEFLARMMWRRWYFVLSAVLALALFPPAWSMLYKALARKG